MKKLVSFIVLLALGIGVFMYILDARSQDIEILPEVVIIDNDREILTIESLIELYNEYKELNPKNRNFDEFMEWLTWRQRLKGMTERGIESGQ